MMAYSDFPPPAEYANFMHHSKVIEYIKDYAKHYGLVEKIRFNTTVKRISRNEDDGKYLVSLESGEIEEFDKLMLCTGHHAQPSYPELKNLDKFKGQVRHAYDYTNPSGYEGKDVFLLGIGNSALDIAVDIAKIAKSVTISTRRGTWIFNRVSQGGMPYDVQLFSRYYDVLLKTVPWTLANDFMEHRLQQRMDHDIYGLRPDHRFFQQHPTVNDALANLLCAGYITVTEDIDTFTE
uniref:Flavin-containing monooxygenase n=1 Tax=Caenorhabditis japonica TaxID=281687 RepID=A0A8R1EJ13_CAEJA